MNATSKVIICGLIIGVIGWSIMITEHIVRNNKLDNELRELLER